MSTVDFLVVGAGMAGASIAAELAGEASVLIVEAEDQPGYHTTGRSAALYIASYGGPSVRALTAASRAFYDAPPPGFVEHALLSPRGCLHIATAGQLEALEALASDLEATGVEIRRIGGDEARAMVPVLNDTVAAGVHEPGAADIDVAALHAGYLRRARQGGVELRTSAGLVAAVREGGAWRITLAGGETVAARTIVNAAGAWGDQLAAVAGVRPVGLSPRRRTGLILDLPAGVDAGGWPAVIDVAEQFYFKPEAGRLMASPADETPSEPVDAAPDEMDIAICVDRLQGAAVIPVRRVVRSWAGLRTFSPDRTPVFGWDADAAGFFWFVGQGGYGIQIAPAAARLGAALALRRPVPADIAAALSAVGETASAFDPFRFR